LGHSESSYATIPVRHFFGGHLEDHESAGDAGIPIALDVRELKPFIRFNSGFGRRLRFPFQADAMAGDAERVLSRRIAETRGPVDPQF